MKGSVVAAKDDISLLQLNERQLLALDALSLGRTHDEAAEAAGVHRVTISTWSVHHPGFIAERNRRKLEMARSASERGRVMVARAVDVILDALEDGDTETAVAVIKWSGTNGVFEVGYPGPTDAEQILADEAEVLASVGRSPTQDLLDVLDRKPPPPVPEAVRRRVEEQHRQALRDSEAQTTAKDLKRNPRAVT
jgi:hypothetical protein